MISVTPNFASVLKTCQAPRETSSTDSLFTPVPGGGYLWTRTTGSLRTIVRLDSSLHVLDEMQYQVTRPLLAVADLNGDGLPDLLFGIGEGMKNQPGFEVRLGTGGAKFGAAVAYYTARAISGTKAIAVSDVNGDGKPDVVITIDGYAPNRVVLFAGNGDGTFQDGVDLAVGRGAGALVVTDLNHDGVPDVAFSAVSAHNPYIPPAVIILWGKGAGAFAEPVTIPVNGVGSLAAGDLDGDGNIDLVTDGSVLFGDGKGGFGDRRDYATGGNMIVDIDGDGRLDIVTANGGAGAISGSDISVLFNHGNRTFSGSRAYPLPVASPNTSTSVHDVLTADLNGDGIPDIVIREIFRLVVMTSRTDGTWQSAFTYLATTSYPADLTIADVNHDGKPDLVVAFRTSGNPAANPLGIQVMTGNGDGTFQAPRAITSTNGTTALRAADLDGDGIADLVAIDDKSIRVFHGDGDGQFRLSGSYSASPQPTALEIADLDGNGRPSVVVSDGASLRIFAAGTDGKLTERARFAEAAYRCLIADLNHDGRLDLVSLLNGGAYDVHINHGNGVFDSTNAQVGSLDSPVFLLDLNGDGMPDMMVQGPFGTTFRLGAGDGTFGAAMPSPFTPAAMADMNGDGTPDAILVTSGVNVAVLFNESIKPSPATVVNSATFLEGPLAPDSIATVFGKGLNANITVMDSGGVVRSATVLYASPTQVNFVVPAGTATGAATLALGSLLLATLTIDTVSPAMFTVSADGLAAGYPVQDSSGRVFLTLYGTGLRHGTVSATVNGLPAQVTWAGAQPETPGLDQVNIALPASLAGTPMVNVVVSANGVAANPVRMATH